MGSEGGLGRRLEAPAGVPSFGTNPEVARDSLWAKPLRPGR